MKTMNRKYLWNIVALGFIIMCLAYPARASLISVEGGTYVYDTNHNLLWYSDLQAFNNEQSWQEAVSFANTHWLSSGDLNQNGINETYEWKIALNANFQDLMLNDFQQLTNLFSFDNAYTTVIDGRVVDVIEEEVRLDYGWWSSAIWPSPDDRVHVLTQRSLYHHFEDHIGHGGWYSYDYHLDGLPIGIALVAYVREDITTVPEPSTLLLFCSSLLGLSWIRRKFK